MAQDDEIKELLDKAAHPHLVASAETANLMLAKLNAVVQDLRGIVAELELQSDLHHNLLMQQEDKSIPLKESEYKISEPYREFKKQAGQLSDIRAIRKAFQRHADLLFEQQKYNKNYQNKAYLG